LTSSVLERLNFFNEGGVIGSSVVAGLVRVGDSGRERERERGLTARWLGGLPLSWVMRYQGAIRLLCSQEGGVSPSAELAAQMRDSNLLPQVFTRLPCQSVLPIPSRLLGMRFFRR